VKARKISIVAGVLVFLGAAAVAEATITEKMFVDSSVVIPSDVTTIVGAVLPESSKVGTSYLSGAFDPNLVIEEPANVFVTFIHEGAGYRNSLGYFTYKTGTQGIEIQDRQLVFPNASYADPSKGWGGGQLATGDTVTLRDAAGVPRVFQSGERVGFFLVADGWNGASVRGWSESAPGLPSATASVNATNRVFTTLDVLNPEFSVGRQDVARHVAMLHVEGLPSFNAGDDFFLVGFEDLRRDSGSDDDFNDVVVLVRSNPVEAILATTTVPYYTTQNPDPDGDGVEGLADYFPNDPERAFVTRTPAAGWTTIAFEDRYPDVGDADFNDCVVDMAFEEVLRADGALTELSGTLHLVARGATLDHEMGVAIPGLPPNASGQLRIERFGSDGTETLDAPRTLDADLLDMGTGLSTLRLAEIFPSTQAALPGDDGLFANTTHPDNPIPPASVRFIVTFDTPIARSPLGAAPFDPYLSPIHDGEHWDIHLRGKPGFPDRPSGLPEEGGDDSFVDESGYPFALLLPEAFRYPLERTRIDGDDGAYPTFDLWKASSGTTHKTWYQSPANTNPPRVVSATGSAYRVRPWTLSVTGH